MPERIKVGVLTHAGGAHLSAYFESLAETDEVESVTLADPDGNSAEMARKVLGKKLVQVYKDHGELLRQEKPPMALVTMEAALAPPVIDAALDAGCHVFAEKPSCVEAADFQKLVRKADSKHLYLMLALANRISPPIVEARRMIREGLIGKIYGQELHIIADQTRLTKADYQKSWQTHKDRSGGGHLMWLGIHWLDLAMFLEGSPIEDVSAFVTNIGGQPIDIEDSAVVTMRFGNGSLGTMTSGYYLDKGYHSHIKIWGSKGWLQLEPRGETPLWWQTPYDSAKPGIQQYTGPKTPAGYPPFVRAAVRACAGLQEVPITNDESLYALKTVFACYRAAETGQRQKVISSS
jgi:predicted dehydrogenase